ncbi:hypothetical protein AcV5_000336 [Taiwanofungus camphoratus]|nr:hypothetical protein AcV5_000336 [Antrodia cinnamomea]
MAPQPPSSGASHPTGNSVLRQASISTGSSTMSTNVNSNTTAVPPPLSYADRAKKAQNIRPVSKTPSTMPGHPPLPPPLTSGAASAAASMSTASSTAPSISTAPTSANVSDISKSKPPSPHAGPDTPSPSSIARDADRPKGDVDGSGLIDVNSAYASGTSNATLTTDSSPASRPEDSVPPESKPAYKPAPPPAVNVWAVRREQMAKARAASMQTQVQQASSSTTPTPSLNPSGGVQSSPHSRPSGGLPDPVATSLPSLSSTALQNVTNQATAPAAAAKPTTTINGHVSPSNTNTSTTNNEHARSRSQGKDNEEHDDPFVVRPGRAPLLDDWPEVGQVGVAGDDGERTGAGGSGKGHEREGSVQGSSGSSRRGEKTKWVPIPAAEMQAAADAHHRPRGHLHHYSHRPSHHHSSNHPRHHHPHQTQNPSASGSMSASGSGTGSQGQSRTHSSVGMRHSQASSSVGSSPPTMTRGRQLLEEGATAQGVSTAVGVGVSMSMSGSGVPSVSGAGSVGSARASLRSSRAGSPGLAGSTGTSLAPNADVGTSAMHVNGITTSYIPPPVSSIPSSYHSPHTPVSPATGAYMLPPHGLPPMAGLPPMSSAYPPGQTPGPYVGTPSYHPYPQYTYGYANPYLYWGPASSVPGPIPVLREIGTPEGVPPHSTLARPPPPAESEAVAGYRDVGFALPPPATYGQPQTQAEAPEEGTNDYREGRPKDVAGGRRARQLSFGSISMVAGSLSPADSPKPPSKGDMAEANNEGWKGDEDEKPIPPFTVGIAPGEPSPARIRSRTRTHSKGHAVELPARAVSEQFEPTARLKDGEGESAGERTAATASSVIGQTDPEARWEFGTTNQLEAGAEIEAKVGINPQAGLEADNDTTTIIPLTNSLGMAPETIPFLSQADMYIPSIPSLPPGSTTIHAPRHIVVPPISTEPNGASSPSYPPASSTQSPGASDEWEVKDYGYGFGSGRAPTTARERREWHAERQQEREYHGRPRRGSYGAGFGHDRGFVGRRGRGAGGRGYHARGYSRGGGYQGSSRQPPFAMQQPPLLHADVAGYYVNPMHTLQPYVAPGYETFAAAYPPYTPVSQNVQPSPPMPPPLSSVSFPLDPTRLALLGQLEYYLSPQNIIQDFWLRQRMDSCGWISILLIAAFPRVTRLTTDYQLVKDVLTLSNLVEVKDECVRMRQWEQFVLPNASKSTIENEVSSISSQGWTEDGSPVIDASQQVEHSPEGDEGEGAGDEEDEEDVVFVLGRDAGRSWTPERRLD